VEVLLSIVAASGKVLRWNLLPQQKRHKLDDQAALCSSQAPHGFILERRSLVDSPSWAS